MKAERPIAPPDAATSTWWDATRQQRLLVQACQACGHSQLYPRGICTECHATSLGYRYAGGRGTIYSFSEVHRAPHPAFEPPYLVALIRLEEGPVVMANLVECDAREVACDLPVVLVWEPLPDGRHLPQFTLAG